MHATEKTYSIALPSRIDGRRPCRRGRTLGAACAAALVALTAVPVAVAGQVKTGNDRAVAKLDKVLRGKLASGSNAQVPVFVTAKGNGAAALKLLKSGHVARKGDVALIVGKIPAQQLPKLAGAAGVALGAVLAGRRRMGR